MIVRSALTATFVGAFALAGCTPVDQGASSPRQRTGEGAAIGAIGGALLGAAVGGHTKDAVIGAAVGTAVGAAIGYSLDKQAAELRSAVDSRIQVINQGDYLLVRMPDDILFAVDSDRVAPALAGDLAALADSLRKYPGSTVDVIGHTDNTGTAAYNQSLSERRAASVKSILVSNGVASGRIRVMGRGENDPIATNQTPGGRAQNRRVDILIRPN